MSQAASKADAFITTETTAIARRYKEEVVAGLTKKGHVVSGDLLKSIESSSEAASQGKGEIALEFLEYGRFIDMGARVGYTKGRRISADDRTAALKGKPPKKSIYYSNVKFGLFARLAHNLSNKYVETMIDLLHTAIVKHGQ